MKRRANQVDRFDDLFGLRQSEPVFAFDRGRGRDFGDLRDRPARFGQQLFGDGFRELCFRDRFQFDLRFCDGTRADLCFGDGFFFDGCRFDAFEFDLFGSQLFFFETVRFEGFFFDLGVRDRFGFELFFRDRAVLDPGAGYGFSTYLRGRYGFAP